MIPTFVVSREKWFDRGSFLNMFKVGGEGMYAIMKAYRDSLLGCCFGTCGLFAIFCSQLQTDQDFKYTPE